MVNKSQSHTEASPADEVRLVISVKEARKLLGKDFSSLKDSQIEDLIIKLDLVAKGFISNTVST